VSERMTTSRFPVRVPSPVRCERCVNRVCEAVRLLPGVTSAECDPHTSTLTVVHDSSAVSRAKLDAEIARLGFEAPKGIEHAAYRVTGLD
jgi:copper chaperone CopZ